MKATVLANATMRGAIFNGIPGQVNITDLPMPTINDPNDAIIKITTAAICGSDLHMYDGYMGMANPPWPLGHEAMGYITQLGSNVTGHHIGDYVVIADYVGHGASKVIYGVGMNPSIGGLQGTSWPAPIDNLKWN
jgi:threonine dehydrogenase-like Zn-dependent dehydrogenase